MHRVDLLVEPTLCGAKSWGMVKNEEDAKKVSKLTENPSCKAASCIIPLEVGVWWGENPVPLPPSS